MSLTCYSVLFLISVCTNAAPNITLTSGNERNISCWLDSSEGPYWFGRRRDENQHWGIYVSANHRHEYIREIWRNDAQNGIVVYAATRTTLSRVGTHWGHHEIPSW